MRGVKKGAKRGSYNKENKVKRVTLGCRLLPKNKKKLNKLAKESGLSIGKYLDIIIGGI